MKYLAFPLFVLVFSQSLLAQGNIDFYTRGMDSFNGGNYSQSIFYLNKFIFSDKISEELLASSQIYIAESYLGLEQIDAAISKFEYFCGRFPTSNFKELALYRLGNLYFEKKLYDKSRSRLKELIQDFPMSEYLGSSYHLVGETFIEENDLSKAEEFFSSAVDSKSNNKFVDRSIYSLANLYEKKGQYSEAVVYYDKLLGYHKSSDLAALAQLRIGVCYFYLNEFDNAVLELSDPLLESLDIDKQNEANYILANAFYKLHEYKNATETYRKILKNSPTSEMLDRIRYGLAWIHFQQNNYNDSYKLFNLLADSPDDSIALKSLFWSGEAKRYDGKYGESIEIHKKFVDLYPDHPYSDKVKLNIGISKFSQNSYTESEESLLDLIQSPNATTKGRALTVLGEIKLRKKEYKTSSQYFERGLNIPQLPIALKDRCYFGLGVSKFYLKNNVEALTELNKITTGNTQIDVDKLNFYKGEINFFLGNYSDALSFYNKINTSDRSIQKNIIYGQAYSHFNQKDFTKAAHYFGLFLKDFKNDEAADECKLRLGDCYYATKSFNKASLYYESALVNSNKFSKDDRSFFNYAQSLFKQGNAIKAISTLHDLQLKFPSSKYADDSQYLIGWIYFQKGKFEDAIESYTNLFSNYSQSALLPIVHYSIGDCYFNLGDYERAINSYNRVISQFPSSSYVYDAINGIQYCYMVEDKQKEAIEYLENFIASNPEYAGNDKVQFKKAEIYYSSGIYSSALAEYKLLVNRYPESSLVSDAYYWMGKSSVLINQYGEAKEYFKVVIDNSINDEIGFNSVLEMGRLFRIENNYDTEIELYDGVIPALIDSKQTGEIKYLKAQNYIEQGKIGEAYTVLNEIVDQRDGSLFYHKAEIELGILEIARENYESSLFLLKDVAENREDDIAAQSHYYIGLNYFEQDKLAEAITELIKVRSLYSAYDEWYTKSLILLGDSYVKINDKESAAEMYKAVLKRHKNNPIAKEVNDKLKRL